MKVLAGFFAIITSLWLAAPVAKAAPSAATPKMGKPNVEILISKNKKSKQVYGDDLAQDMMFEMKIRNKDSKQSYSNMVAVVYVFGKEVETKNYILLGKAEAEVAVGPKEEQILTTDAISIESDTSGGTQYGVKYEGYSSVLKDDKGNVLMTKCSKESFIKNLKKLDKIEVGETFIMQQIK